MGRVFNAIAVATAIVVAYELGREKGWIDGATAAMTAHFRSLEVKKNESEN